MHSSRYGSVLSTAFLTVLALMLTVPFKVQILTDVTPAIHIAYR
jgi:hypothetical protein